MTALLHCVWLNLGSSLSNRGYLPQRPSPRASSPKDHVPEPWSSHPGGEQPSTLAFGPQDLILDVEGRQPSPLVFAPQDTPSRSAGAWPLLRKQELDRTLRETLAPVQQLQTGRTPAVGARTAEDFHSGTEATVTVEARVAGSYS